MNAINEIGKDLSVVRVLQINFPREGTYLEMPRFSHDLRCSWVSFYLSLNFAFVLLHLSVQETGYREQGLDEVPVLDLPLPPSVLLGRTSNFSGPALSKWV